MSSDSDFPDDVLCDILNPGMMWRQALVTLFWAWISFVALGLPEVLFESEPLEIRLPEGVVPEAFVGGIPFELPWEEVPLEEGGVLWRARFPGDAPLGPWYVEAGEDRFSFIFIRVPKGMGVLWGKGFAGMWCAVEGERKPMDPQGHCWFILPPGKYTFVGILPGGEEISREGKVAAGESAEVVFVGPEAFSLEASPVAEVSLSGNEFAVKVSFFSEVPLPSLCLSVELPEGWKARVEGGEGTCYLRPVYPERELELALIVSVPEGIQGSFGIIVGPDFLNLKRTVSVRVARCLDPVTAVLHWDLGEGKLDFTSPATITYEKLLWAASMLGKRVPGACRTLNRSDLIALADIWSGAEGEAP